MKRRTRSVPFPVQVFAVLAFCGLAFVIMVGCSPSRMEPDLAPRAVRDLETCLHNSETCFMLHARNDLWNRMVVRLNGIKLGEVEGGGGSESFPVPESYLRNGRCASVELYLIGPGSKARSDQQCIRQGGWFNLQLDLEGKIWLVPWGSE